MVIQHLNNGFRDVTEKTGEMDVVKKSGGSIIERPAVFSSCGKNLFVVWGNCIRSYNVETSELVTVYHGLSKDAIGVALHPRNPNKLIAVSAVGEFVEWDRTSRGSFVRKIQLGENEGQYVLHSFALVPQSDDDSLYVVCVAAKPKQDRAVVRMFCSTTGIERNIVEKMRIENHNRSLAVRQNDGETLIAGFCNQPRTTINFRVSYDGSETNIIKAFSKHEMTCIACHPTDLCVITGDIIGCVRVWKNILRKPMSSMYHWHTLPVQTLAFSDSGSYFYSGGGECVLVRWLFDSGPSENVYLPRLPAEIAHLTVSARNTYVAVSTRDNGIQLIDVSSFNIVGIIQHFSWSSLPSVGKYLMPLEMTTDPRTKALVANGRVGHLQFFSVDQENLLYVLDVVGRNYLTQERFKIIKNTEVVKFAFSTDGSWLASVEFSEDDGKSPMEMRLKFWEYNKVKQQYVLNTCVENPHRGKVNAIQFRPSINNENLMCVTTGEDLKFRTWSLEEGTSIYRKGYNWTSENIGFYRNLPVQALSFSSDGSLMAIAFGPTLTVWIPGSNQLKCSLTRPDTEEHLSHVEFGRKKCVHLVITGSKIGIAVWNLLSVSLLWVVHFNLALLVSDPISETVAAFSDQNDFVVFFPNSPDPIFKQNFLLPHEESKIANAVFVPHARQKNSNVSWQSKSQLLFFNTRQELFCLQHSTLHTDPEEGRNLDVLPAESFRPRSAYSALLAQEHETDVVDIRKEQHKHLGIPGFKTLRELVEAPAHAMPPLSLVSYSLLMSFIPKASGRSDGRSRLQSSDDESEMEYDASDEDQSSDNREEKSSTTNVEEEEKSKTFVSKAVETPSVLADTERCLRRIQRKSLNWVSELLT